MTGELYDVVVPVSYSHLEQINVNLEFIYRFLNPHRIIVLCRRDLTNKIRMDYSPLILDEDCILEGLCLNSIKIAMEGILRKSGWRAGWYFQQFLKMAYSMVTDKEYYVVWDSDTIPLHNIEFLSHDGKMLFNFKEEHHIPYFNLIKKLFKGKVDEQQGSFISEGMIIKTSVMRNLIHDIEQNDDIKGKNWWEKIINSIDIEELEGSGFSEFETYGNYLRTYYPDSLSERSLCTERNGYRLYGKVLAREELNRIKHLDTISFENTHEKENIIHDIDFNKLRDCILSFDMEESLFRYEYSSFLSFLDKHDSLYIYGHGSFGKVCFVILIALGYQDRIGGFISTESILDSLYEVPVYLFKDFINQKRHCDGENGIILALNNVNKMIVKTLISDEVLDQHLFECNDKLWREFCVMIRECKYDEEL